MTSQDDDMTKNSLAIKKDMISWKIVDSDIADTIWNIVDCIEWHKGHINISIKHIFIFNHDRKIHSNRNQSVFYFYDVLEFLT